LGKVGVGWGDGLFLRSFDALIICTENGIGKDSNGFGGGFAVLGFLANEGNTGTGGQVNQFMLVNQRFVVEGEGREGDVTQYAIGNDNQAFLIHFSGGGEDKLTELVGGLVNICCVIFAVLNGIQEFSCGGVNLFLGGENVGGESVFGNDPEVAFFFANGVLQKGGVGIENLLLDLG